MDGEGPRRWQGGYCMGKGVGFGVFLMGFREETGKGGDGASGLIRRSGWREKRGDV